MLKNVITDIQQLLGHLTAVCARPGDGRLTFAIELANELVQKGETVYFCSFSRTKQNLQYKLHSSVQILSTLPDGEKHFLKRFDESARIRNGFVLVDNLSAVSLIENPADRFQKKADMLAQMKEIATRRNIHIIVTDTFSHASDTDDMLPIPCEALDQCDSVYILHKDDITVDNADDPTAYMPKLKEIK